jgi:hypothetical protein
MARFREGSVETRERAHGTFDLTDLSTAYQRRVNCQRKQSLDTPKALANCSPGLLQPWDEYVHDPQP